MESPGLHRIVCRRYADTIAKRVEIDRFCTAAGLQTLSTTFYDAGMTMQERLIQCSHGWIFQSEEWALGREWANPVSAHLFV